MEAPAQACGGRVLNLGPATRVPLGEGKVFDADGVAVAVFRTRDGRLFASEASCPHRQGPLADGMLGGALLVCPLHGFKFDLASGKPVGNDCRALVTYPITLTDGGEMLLSLGRG